MKLYFEALGSNDSFKKALYRAAKASIDSGDSFNLNVYIDQSGSWTQSEINDCMRSLSILDKYMNEGKINLNRFYFGSRVSSTPSNVGTGSNCPAVVEHINKTNPDNVLIASDSDGNYMDYPESATVPGKVWFLWRNGDRSGEFMKHVSGQLGTSEYML